MSDENRTENSTNAPRVGETWTIRVMTQLPERQHETFTATIAAEDGTGRWAIRPQGKSAAWPIWFGRHWFVQRLAAAAV